MNSIETVREFLGWCCVINIGILMLTSICLILLRGLVVRIHSKLMNMDESDLNRAYFQYLAQFKIAVIVLNIAPYCALLIMK